MTEIIKKENINKEEIRDFFDQWNVYLKVINNNYMFHNEIYNALHKILNDFSQQNRISLLDLGCGDASLISDTLKNIDISYYCGIDLSEIALNAARDNLKKHSFDTSFSQGDFFEIINQYTNKFDVILSGYSLHHLNFNQKDILFNRCKLALKKYGILIIYDEIRKNNESRDEYISRYCNICLSQWDRMTKKELNMIKKHITEKDFPESLETYKSLSKKHGFKNVDSIYQDSLMTHELICFYN